MTVHSDGYRPVEVKVWGEFACFTRPEMKVERVTYPVITPSAVRGMLEAIFWKPEFPLAGGRNTCPETDTLFLDGAERDHLPSITSNGKEMAG